MPKGDCAGLPMSDQILRAAQRSGDPIALLRERCRAGLRLPVHSKPCDCPSPMGVPFHGLCGGSKKESPCHSPTWPGPSFEVALNLQAFIGVEEARVALNWSKQPAPEY